MLFVQTWHQYCLFIKVWVMPLTCASYHNLVRESIDALAASAQSLTAVQLCTSAVIEASSFSAEGPAWASDHYGVVCDVSMSPKSPT